MSEERERCPDDGACHHECGPDACFRVRCCGPLSNVYPGDEWPNEVRVANGLTPRYEYRVTTYDGWATSCPSHEAAVKVAGAIAGGRAERRVVEPWVPLPAGAYLAERDRT